MEEKIIEILRKISGVKEIDSTMDLIENEILDSLILVEFIVELEETFGIEIQPTLVKPSVWHTVEGIAKFIKQQI